MNYYEEFAENYNNTAQEVAVLTKNNDELRKENKVLRQENDILAKQNEDIAKDIDNLKKLNDQLRSLINAVDPNLLKSSPYLKQNKE